MTIVDMSRAEFAELENIATVSDKIRHLDQKGYARADIARILGKRYQHVRNVLEADALKAAQASEAQDGPALDGAFRLEIGRDGSIMIPQGVMAALGISGGGVLAARLDDGELRLADPLVALRKVQEMLKPMRERLRKEGISLSDELIAERRAEAMREVRE
ncbi:MAG: hypothetical protein KDK00_05320 [Rhodobacteraceae bacterium]|nr:hypothetical protein [Paracoccaceae bacterium]